VSGALATALLSPPTRAAGSGRAASFDPIVFELRSGTGVDFVTNSSRTHLRHQPETMPSGVAVLDYDNDGRLDIYAVNGAKMTSLDKTDPVYWNRLYRNKGDFTFEDVTEKAGVKGKGYELGVAAGDYDNDGDTDLSWPVFENVLFRNGGTARSPTSRGPAWRARCGVRTLLAVAAAFSTSTRTETSTCSSRTVCGMPRSAALRHPVAHTSSSPLCEPSQLAVPQQGTPTDVSVRRHPQGGGRGGGWESPYDGDG
jgi:hypothetical protein